jgi:16S rRNA (guanine1516-N2)-methyltransferase
MNFLTAKSKFQLVYNKRDNCLELCDLISKNSRPIRIDFLSPQLQQRQKSLVNSRELIAKAIGYKKGQMLRILDATAGFGVDAFMMARLGHDVTMLERSPIIAALLQDGLNRLFADVSSKHLKLKLVNVDAIVYMKQLGEKDRPDVVYLDPMYPARSKTALNKKTLRILREVVGEDWDVMALFQAALHCAKKRVVVKRPRLAKKISDMVPTFVISGKSCRYDVYQIA